MTPLDILTLTVASTHVVLAIIAIHRIFILNYQSRRARLDTQHYGSLHGKIVYHGATVDESEMTPAVLLCILYTAIYILAGVGWGLMCYEWTGGFYFYAVLGYSMAGILVAIDSFSWTSNGGKSWLFMCDFIDQKLQDDLETIKYNSENPAAPKPTRKERERAALAAKAITIEPPKEASTSRRLIRK